MTSRDYINLALDYLDEAKIDQKSFNRIQNALELAKIEMDEEQYARENSKEESEESDLEGVCVM